MSEKISFKIKLEEQKEKLDMIVTENSNLKEKINNQEDEIKNLKKKIKSL